MRRPSPDFRAHVAESVERLETEEQLDELLDEIERQIDQASTERASPADVEYTAVLEWTSIVSYAVARYYAPASPWPWGRKAGWDPKIGVRLEKLAGAFKKPMKSVLDKTDAVSFSISVGFPWGISVGLSWGPRIRS
jgi:hypothetical protein